MHRNFILLCTLTTFVLLGCGGGGSSNTKTLRNYKLTLDSNKAIAGYEVVLQFSKDTSTQKNTILNNDFLGTSGRVVNNLGVNIKSVEKKVSFGGYSVGKQEAVSGRFDVLAFKSKDVLSQISIVSKTCMDKNAREVDCDVEIVEGV